ANTGSPEHLMSWVVSRMRESGRPKLLLRARPASHIWNLKARWTRPVPSINVWWRFSRCCS
ncbi:uncharacterized protein METZ01_LOCUS292168, partial [marine metagenome]